MGFGDGKSIHRALVSTWVQGDAACFVFNVAVLSCDAVALQRDVCLAAAQRGSPCNKRKHFLSARYRRFTCEYFGEVFLGCGLRARGDGCHPRGQGHMGGVANGVSMRQNAKQQV